MGSGIGDDEAICDPSNETPCDYRPNEGDMADAFEQFAGMPCEGDWTFTVGDSTSGDTGTLVEWAIAFPCIQQDVPTVSEWGLIIMALLALTAGTIVFARRRRPASLEL